MHRSPYFRLGTGPNNTSNPGAVKSHPFFEGLDWDRLYRREYTPPFVPTVAHLYDLRNIDPQFVNEPIPQSILNDGHLTATVTADAFHVELDAQHGMEAAERRLGQTFRGFTFVGDEEWLYHAEDFPSRNF